MSAISFSISRWAAWGPGLDSPEAWAAWSRGEPRADSPTEPDSSFVPAGTRRRLSPLARMVFAVARGVVDDGETLPTVFASRHGELDRTVELLSSIARDQDLSPTSFGLSVHNAIVGQWSMFRTDRSEVTAIAAVEDGLELALVEAAAILGERPGPVLVLFAEGDTPEPYTSLVSDVPFRHALALRVERGADWTLTREAPAGAGAGESSALVWLRANAAVPTSFRHDTARVGWVWTRA